MLNTRNHLFGLLRPLAWTAWIRGTLSRSGIGSRPLSNKKGRIEQRAEPIIDDKTYAPKRLAVGIHNGKHFKPRISVKGVKSSSKSFNLTDFGSFEGLVEDVDAEPPAQLSTSIAESGNLLSGDAEPVQGEPTCSRKDLQSELLEILTIHDSGIIVFQQSEKCYLYGKKLDSIALALNLTISKKAERALVSTEKLSTVVRQISEHFEEVVYIYRSNGLQWYLYDCISSDMLPSRDESAIHNILSISFPDNLESNIEVEKRIAGLCWIDRATEILTYSSVPLKELACHVARINPVEILSERAISRSSYFREHFALLSNYTIREAKYVHSSSLTDYHTLFGKTVQELTYLEEEMSVRERKACIQLLKYRYVNPERLMITLTFPQREEACDIMKMDSSTVKSLNLFQVNYREKISCEGSLLSVIRRTKTAGGGRLLEKWVASPLTDYQQIMRRQKIVEYLLENECLREMVVASINNKPDTVKILQKIRVKSSIVTVSDLASISKVIKLYSFMKTLIGGTNKELKGIAKYMTVPEKLSKVIDEQIIEVDSMKIDVDDREPLDNSSIDSWDWNPEFSLELKLALEQKAIVKKSKGDLLQMFTQLQGAEYDIKYVQDEIFGTLVEVKKKKQGKEFICHIEGIKIHQHTKGSLVRIKNDKVAVIDEELLTLERRLEIIRGNLMKKAQKRILKESKKLLQCDNYMCELDVLSSFALLALEKNLVKPEIVKNQAILKVEEGRNIALEAALAARQVSVVKNDILIGQVNGDRKLSVVSGPNMGGKSTYLRMCGILVVMTQIGCFVPAKKACVGIIDRIFTRIGAADDVYRGRSTFHMEMLEVSQILNNASQKSLAIVDEVGRGTSSRDGLAIACAVAHTLSEINECMTVFATHFGIEMHDRLEKKGVKASYKRTGFEGGKPTFKLTSGVSLTSHGLEVAQLADFPEEVMMIAKSNLSSPFLKTI